MIPKVCCQQVLAPCAPMPNRNTETEIWRIRNREVFYFLCQAKGRHSRLAPQELCPPPLGIGEDFIRRACSPGYIIRIKVVKVLHFFFFPLHYFKTVIAGVRQPGNWGPAAW